MHFFFEVYTVMKFLLLVFPELCWKALILDFVSSKMFADGSQQVSLPSLPVVPMFFVFFFRGGSGSAADESKVEVGRLENSFFAFSKNTHKGPGLEVSFSSMCFFFLN